MDKAPLGIRLLRPCCGGDGMSNTYRTTLYKYFILLLTFLCYTAYHLSRKPISVVKPVLRGDNESCQSDDCGWEPFNSGDGKEILGSLDYAYLFSYAIAMFLSGHVAERMDLRYFLSLGMLLSGLLTAAFGFGYYLNIHNITYYIIIQIIGGVFQSTGWPAVVACVGNWFGKAKRGFIFGVWNAHTSIGNILGSVIAAAFVTQNWGLSFIVPGLIIAGVGVLVFLVLVPDPEDIGCELPDHSGDASGNASHENVPLLEEKCPPPQAVSSDRPASGNSGNSGSAASEGTQAAISIWGALKIPGVVEFSLCLLCAKLVSYTFLYWLPTYIKEVNKLDPEESGYFSTLFDVGGIIGGIAAGVMYDKSGAGGCVSVLMLLLGAPMLWIYYFFSSLTGINGNVVLLMALGFLVNGPYALITTAISATLGTHHSIRGSSRALATVTAIVDGTGSIGAALGPLLAGVIPGWAELFYTLMGCDLLAALCISRVVLQEIRKFRHERMQRYLQL